MYKFLSQIRRRRPKSSAKAPEEPVESREGRFPYELLATIFEEGARSTYREAGGVPFAVTVSHVCRDWRAASCGTSRLWTYMPVYPGRDDMTKMFLARAGEHPLDISLLIEYRHIGQPITRETLQLVLPSAPRWASLCIHADSQATMYVVWMHMHKWPDLSGLRRVELRLGKKQVSFEWVPQSADLEQRPYLGREFLDGFTSLVLRGLSGHMVSFLCSGLFGKYNDPFPSKFRVMCTKPLPLTHLTLVGMLPETWDLPLGDQIILPSLLTLHISIGDGPYSSQFSYIPQFFCAISAPSLQLLSFDSRKVNAWERFEEALPTIGSKFKDLRTLHLAITDPLAFHGDSANPEPFNGSFSNLQELTLNVARDDQAVYFLRAWFDSLSGGRQGMWLRLTTLTIRAPYDSPRELCGAFPIDHYVTLLEGLLLSNSAGELPDASTRIHSSPSDHADPVIHSYSHCRCSTLNPQPIGNGIQ